MSLESADQKQPNPSGPETAPAKNPNSPSPPLPIAESNSSPTTTGECRLCKPERDWHDKVMLWVEIVGVIFLIAYTTVATLQWCAMRDQLAEMGKQQAELIRTNDISIDSNSPLIYVYDISLTNRIPDRPPHHPIPIEDKIRLLETTDHEIRPYIAIEFENFGTRAAIVDEMDIEGRVLPSLPDKPSYSGRRSYSVGIRPSEQPPIPEAIVDNHNPLKLSADDIATIKSGKASLWIYGFVRMEIFGHRTEIYGFCSKWHAEKWDTPPEGFSGGPCPAAYNYRERNPK